LPPSPLQPLLASESCYRLAGRRRAVSREPSSYTRCPDVRLSLPNVYRTPDSTTTLQVSNDADDFLYHHHHHLFCSNQLNKKTYSTHDQHENESRTRKAQKTGAYILSINHKKHTQYKNNYDYAYCKNAEKSTRLSDRLNLDNDEKSTVWGKKFQTFIILSTKIYQLIHHCCAKVGKYKAASAGETKTRVAHSGRW